MLIRIHPESIDLLWKVSSCIFFNVLEPLLLQFFETPILLLDEATNALDVKTEKQVLSNLKAMKDMTVIIVTHRLEALSICSREVQFKVKEDE